MIIYESNASATLLEAQAVSISLIPPPSYSAASFLAFPYFICIILKKKNSVFLFVCLLGPGKPGSYFILIKKK